MKKLQKKSEASRSRSMRFKERSSFQSITVQGEAVSADVEAVPSYLENLAKIINEGDYTRQQTFDTDETAFYWKMMPSRTFIPRGKVSTWLQSFKA